MKDLTGCCPFPVEEALASPSAFLLAFLASSAAAAAPEGAAAAAAAGAAFMSGGAVMATAKLFFLPEVFSSFSSFFGSGQPLLRSSAIFAQDKKMVG